MLYSQRPPYIWGGLWLFFIKGKIKNILAALHNKVILSFNLFKWGKDNGKIFKLFSIVCRFDIFTLYQKHNAYIFELA